LEDGLKEKLRRRELKFELSVYLSHAVKAMQELRMS
jgi:hypothetical protein